MEMTHTEQNGIQIIALSGKIMGEPGESMIGIKINELIDSNKPAVVLDLSQVTWMNSTGLGICLGALTRLRSRGGDLKLVGLPKVVESLMEKCNILTLFHRFDSLDKALHSF
jgi:anti-sigma B factor antagonist